MSKQKKLRNKRYTPRAVSIPMMPETRDAVALRLRLSIETLIAAPSVESYNHVSLQFVTLGRVVLPAPEFMEQAKATMLAVFERFQRVGKMGVSAAEAGQLRDVSRLMDDVIARVPVHKFAAAQARTAQWCQANDIAI